MPHRHKHIDTLPDEDTKKLLLWNIFPEGKTHLPIQDFLKWFQARKIIDKHLPKEEKLSDKKEEALRIKKNIVSYLEISVKSGSKDNIVEKLQDIHMRELSAERTRIRANKTLAGDTSDITLAQVNQNVDISETILSELEPFVITLMNVDYFRFETDPRFITSAEPRKTTLHRLKKRFLETVGLSGSLPESARNLFIEQLKKAYWRISPNHPVHGFIGTILYEVSAEWSNFRSNYFRDIETSPWFGFGCNLDDDFLSKIPDENTWNRFCFSEISTSYVDRRIQFKMNTLLFSPFKGVMNAIDEKWLFGTARKGIKLWDNAGAFSYYEDSCIHGETGGKSDEWIRKVRGSTEKDEYYGPASYSYGNLSFRHSPWLAGGFRNGQYDNCFFEAEWFPSKANNKNEETLYGSVCASSGKKSFIHPGADLSPKKIEDNSFDYSVCMCGFSKTIVEKSLRETIFVSSKDSPIGEEMIIPALDSNHEEVNTALKESIIIGENCLVQMDAKDGLKKAILLYAGKNANLSWYAAIKSIWFGAGIGAKVHDTACVGAKISGKSFCGSGTEITDNSFYGAETSGEVGQEAFLSGYPFKACSRVPRIDTLTQIQEVLKGKASLLVKNIRSMTIARNDAIHNTILKIPFEGGSWNFSVGTEDIERIKWRLKLLLSSSFGETMEEKHNRRKSDRNIQTDNAELIAEAHARIEAEEWKRTFDELLSDPIAATKNLEQFRAGKIVLDIKNWLDADAQWNPGVSREIAEYAIQKIRDRLWDITNTVSQESAPVALIEIIRTYSKVTQEVLNFQETIARSFSFQNATFKDMHVDFWESELGKFGESESKKIREKFNPLQWGVFGLLKTRK